MNVKASVWVFLLGIFMVVVSSLADAASRVAVSRADKNITFTITEKPCALFDNIPKEAMLKDAYAYDAKNNQTIKGCALDYGQQIEFQLVDESKKKHYQIVLPAGDFIRVEDI